MAWGYYELPSDVFNGETVEEWIPLTGKQGDEKEGNINFIFTLLVSKDLMSNSCDAGMKNFFYLGIF